MDKRDAGRYKYSRRGGSEFSVQNQNSNSVDKIQQPPWKLGISGSSGSSSGGSHNRPQKTSIPEKSRFPTVDTTKSVRRSSFRTQGTRQFEEKQKHKPTFVGESSSSNSSTTTGKTVTQVLNETEVPDIYPSVCTQAISSNSSSRFLSQLNKQINLGSSSNSTGSGMQRRGGIKSMGCTSVSDVISSSAEGVRKRANGEGSSTRARSLTGRTVDLNVPTTIRGVPQAGSRIHRVFARTSEIDFQAPRANWTLTSSQEDERSEDEDDEEEVEPEEEEEEEEEEIAAAAAQPRPFAFLLPHQLFSASNQSRWDSSFGSGLDSISNSSSDSTSGLSSRMASWSGEEESGRAGHRVVQRGLRLRDREPYQRDRIAEVLLALERIEQHGDLSHDEQLLIIETNFLLNGLTFHDEHRDMRMDIDNMSYEELLALEEKMGTVSTALSEEEFANCLKRSLYHESSPHSIDDVKCSICQEEYENGEEIGVLKCEHWYHVSCIHDWLRQKNWCPVCKAPQNDR
ncbi:RING/U-box superfamily protein [Rhynchospora pubera]|uniref:RING-type E3 ubiquitin transferase n=1 Tax=Rhynchospora pubera TaxID=906938 RepID=A0AAV8FFZ8_9POAL|nr:RING/U-box superfamily protein [Rhynchospora pubera]